MANYLPVLLVSVSTNAVPDDSSLVTGPRGQVDYLSHDWQEEDVWRSWRNMTRQKNEIANGARLENASWRTWWKQRNKLKTVSPETLNWLKDSDVTWLYGPLHTAVEWTPPPKPAPVPDTVDTDPASAHDRLDLSSGRPRRPAPHKPILKHRSISELLTSDFPPSPAFSPVESEEDDDDDDGTRVNTALNRTDSLSATKLRRPSLTHTKSDTHITRWGASRAFRKESPPRIDPPGFDADPASYFPPHLSPSSALAAPAGIRASLSQDSASSGSAEREKGHHPKKKHISFNTFVEQCIAIEKPKKNASGFFGVGNHNEEGVWIEGGAGFVDDDGYDEDQEDSEGEEEEEEVYGEEAIWEGAGARAIRSDSDSPEEEEGEEEDILEMRTHHSHSTTKPKPKKPPRSQSAVSTASSSSSASTSTTTSTSSRSSSGTTSTTSPASSLSPSRRNAPASDNNNNGALLRKSSTSSSTSTTTAKSRRRGSGSGSTSTSGSTSGYRAGRPGAPPLIRTPSAPVHVTIAPIAPTILKTGGAWEEGFGDEGASDDGFGFAMGAGAGWGGSKDGKGKERRGTDNAEGRRVRSGHGPELDGYGTGGGYISNDGPSSTSSSPRLGASHHNTLSTSPSSASASASRSSATPRRQFSIATGRGLGLGGAQEQQRYDDAQGGSSDGTPVELVYCPPIGSNYSLGAGVGDGEVYGGGGGGVYASVYGSGYASGYGSEGGLGYEGDGYAPGRYAGGYGGYAGGGMYAGGYGGAGGSVIGGVYGPGGVHANARYEVAGRLQTADEAEEEHVENVVDGPALALAGGTTKTADATSVRTNGLPDYLHPTSVRAAPIPISAAAEAVPTVVVEGAPAPSLLSTSAPGGGRSGVAAMRMHQQKSKSSASLNNASPGIPTPTSISTSRGAVDEEDAYDFFGGTDLGGDYYYARRGGRGYEREYAPSPAASAPQEQQQPFAAPYQAAYQHSVGGAAEREPRSATRDRDRGSDARRPARGALAAGDERPSRSRSRSQSRTPSPAFLASPAPAAPPNPSPQPIAAPVPVAAPISPANAAATAYANAYASAYATSVTTAPGGGRRRSSSASAPAPPGAWMSASASAPALDAGFLSPPLQASLLSQGRPSQSQSQASSPSPTSPNPPQQQQLHQQQQSHSRGRSSTRTPSSTSSSWERGGASLGSSPIGSLSPDALGARGGVSPTSSGALGAVLGGAAVLAGSGRCVERERGEKEGERERGRERRGRDRTSGKVLGASVAAVPPPPAVTLVPGPPAPAVADAATETASTTGEESSCGSSTVGDARTATGSVILQHPVRVPTPTITIPTSSSVREVEEGAEADDAIHQDVLVAHDDPAAAELRYLRRAEEEQRRRVHPTPSNSPIVEMRRMASAYTDTAESTSASGSGGSGGATPTGSSTPSAASFPSGTADAPPAAAASDGGHTQHTQSSPVTLVHHGRSSSFSSVTSGSSPAKMRPPTLSPTPVLPARPSTSFTAASSPRLSSPIASPGSGGSSVAAVAGTGAFNATSTTTASHSAAGQDTTIVAKAVDIMSSAGAYFGLWGRDDMGR